MNNRQGVLWNDIWTAHYENHQEMEGLYTYYIISITYKPVNQLNICNFLDLLATMPIVTCYIHLPLLASVSNPSTSILKKRF